MMLSMFWTAPAMQYSRSFCVTKVAGLYRSIVNGVFVGDATGVGAGSDGVDTVAEATETIGLALAACVALAVARPVGKGEDARPPAFTPGTTAITAIQPTAAMSAHSAA
jgi:hypothetical protein